ncbi:hypothetical protein [Candidatus Harpocratesius sp.]
MLKDKLKKEYRELLTKIFGSDVVSFYLNSESDQIDKTNNEIEAFWKNYVRFTPINIKNSKGKTILELKGCGNCISAKRFVLQQEFPGWVSNLDNINYIIIGKEISQKVKTHTHIAYEYFPSSVKCRNRNRNITPISGKLDLFFKDILKSAYITDIAKCLCTDKKYARTNCASYLKEEIKILHELNPNIMIIIQGIGNSVWVNLGEEFALSEKEEVEKDDNNNRILRLRYIENLKIPVIIFPHSSNQNQHQWKYLRENKAYIQSRIREFLLKSDLKGVHMILGD